MKKDPTFRFFIKFPVMNLFRLQKKDTVRMNGVNIEIDVMSSLSLFKENSQVEIVFVRMRNVRMVFFQVFRKTIDIKSLKQAVFIKFLNRKPWKIHA